MGLCAVGWSIVAGGFSGRHMGCLRSGCPFLMASVFSEKIPAAECEDEGEGARKLEDSGSIRAISGACLSECGPQSAALLVQPVRWHAGLGFSTKQCGRRAIEC